ncbi:M48 family metallopeptidase [Parvularcula sp. ZS-1/3]|uniref:M48 family metallopeptidase n=1 Tax=Parvularcula mediterranea TaxID=2732508 RepID=A0A7Y3RNG1_9PROT|nr:M48 family metallopeptidase [Parvularcula mediterranea]NNU17215.1 M48 family metallopeptidase [Parvularcula mediterranea]
MASASDITPVAGKFYRAGSGTPVPARLTVERKLVRIAEAGGGPVLAEEARGDVAISARLGSVPRRVEMIGSWTFETDDNDGIDRAFGGFGRGALSALEGSLPAILVAVVFVVVSLIGITVFGLPAATQAAVDRTPQEAERAIAAGSMRSLDATLFRETEADESRREALQEAFAELVSAYENQPWAREDVVFRLDFRHAPAIGPNALALPGGQVVVTDDLLDVLEEDEMVAAVLAHEIAHVHHRHGLYALYRSAGVGALILFLGGDLSALAEDAVVQGAVLSNLSVSRRSEREADRTGAQLAAAAGLDPMALLEALEALTGADADEKSSWLSSHPGLKDRAKAIREATAER